IFVMMFTFLNLIAVSGVLVGLVVGAERAVRDVAYGDVVISAKNDEDHILETATFAREIMTYPEVTAYSVRYQGGATIEANYEERRDLRADPESTTVKVTGIDVMHEDTMSHLSSYISEGSYLDPNEEGKIL